MFLEALEILNSAGEEDDSFVTDFALYKVIYILTVYSPLLISTFLFSQEYLGEKIACFPPENFTDSQAGAVNEFCWNNGFWVSKGTELEKSLYTQPHRYFSLYLPVQAIICTIPIIFWNVMTKSKLLATLRGTEEFCQTLIDMITEARDADSINQEEIKEKVKGQLHHFHHICMTSSEECNLSLILTLRKMLENVFFFGFLFLQIWLYDQQEKYYHCTIPTMSPDEILCTLPVLDLLDFLWTINVSSLGIAFVLSLYSTLIEIGTFFGNFQPLFINELPYGKEDDFNEHISWDSNFTKHSYELISLIMAENNPIMTKVYVLNAMQPLLEEKVQKELAKQAHHSVETPPVEQIPREEPGQDETTLRRRRLE